MLDGYPNRVEMGKWGHFQEHPVMFGARCEVDSMKEIRSPNGGRMVLLLNRFPDRDDTTVL